jgi:multidrug efflux pump subunit AcrB
MPGPGGGDDVVELRDFGFRPSSLTVLLAAALGMLPLARGSSSGADRLKPLAIAVMGALCISGLLSLISTPTVY